MTLDFTKLLENSVRKEMTVSHFEGDVKVQTVSSLPENVVGKINEQYGDKYLGDADYVLMFKGPFDAEDSKKLYKLTNRALGVDANRMTEGDFKFIKLDKTIPWVAPEDAEEEIPDDVEAAGDAGEFNPPEDEVEPDENAEAPEEAPAEDAEDDETEDFEDSEEAADDENAEAPEEDAEEELDEAEEEEEDDTEEEGVEADGEDFEPPEDEVEPDENAEAPEEDAEDDAVDYDEDGEGEEFEPPEDEETEDVDAADYDDSVDQPEDGEAVQKPTAFAFLKITMK